MLTHITFSWKKKVICEGQNVRHMHDNVKSHQIVFSNILWENACQITQQKIYINLNDKRIQDSVMSSYISYICYIF